MRRSQQKVFRWGGFLLGAVVLIWKGTLGKALTSQGIDRESGESHEGKAQFQKQDAVGVFRLGYVDCEPYSGPEQLIQIDEEGEVECVQPSFLGGRIGKLKTGTLLKGELEPAPGFVSAAKATARVASLKMQVVSLPGGPPGVWLAMSTQRERGAPESWDEIYVRPAFERRDGVAT